MKTSDTRVDDCAARARKYPEESLRKKPLLSARAGDGGGVRVHSRPTVTIRRFMSSSSVVPSPTPPMSDPTLCRPRPIFLFFFLFSFFFSFYCRALLVAPLYTRARKKKRKKKAKKKEKKEKTSDTWMNETSWTTTFGWRKGEQEWEQWRLRGRWGEERHLHRRRYRRRRFACRSGQIPIAQVTFEPRDETRAGDESTEKSGVREPPRSSPDAPPPRDDDRPTGGGQESSNSHTTSFKPASTRLLHRSPPVRSTCP